jgi:hypothetical protein
VIDFFWDWLLGTYRRAELEEAGTHQISTTTYR